VYRAADAAFLVNLDLGISVQLLEAIFSARTLIRALTR
jgi:hypothetical protein